MKVIEIVEAYSALKKLSTYEGLSSTAGYRILKNIGILQSTVDAYEAKRNEWLEANCEKSGNGYNLSPDDQVKLVAFMSPLEQEDEELPSTIRKLKIGESESDFPNGIPPALFLPLMGWCIIDSEDAKCSSETPPK
ncbi:MAG: hypothetical protein ACE5EE_10895 [Fidelibacterota bacterium]